MKTIDQLLLTTGGEIPFEEARLTIHNPTMREIGMCGEENFHIGTQFLVFSKNQLSDKDKADLEKQSDFNIFMAVMSSSVSAEHKTCAKQVFSLLFPGLEIEYKRDHILLQLNKENTKFFITERNFDEFRNLINQMFCLRASSKGGYHPKDGYAKRIADKLAERQRKLNKGKQSTKISVFDQYLSLLSIGMHIDLNTLSNYTVYQLMVSMKRFQLKYQFDINIRARLAGATDIDEAENWMEDISILEIEG